MHAAVRGRGRVVRPLFWLLVVGIGVVVLLPSHVLAWMRRHWQWFNLPMGWIEHAQLPFNLVHAILFAGLGIGLRLAFPRVRPWREAGWLVLFCAVSEVVQLWVPGRHARWGDFAVDLAAALVGMLLVVVGGWGVRGRRGCRSAG